MTVPEPKVMFSGCRILINTPKNNGNKFERVGTNVSYITH